MMPSRWPFRLFSRRHATLILFFFAMTPPLSLTFSLRRAFISFDDIFFLHDIFAS